MDDELDVAERRRIVAGVSTSKIQTNDLHRAANIYVKNQMSNHDIEQFMKNKNPVVYEGNQEVLIITKITQLGTEVFEFKEETPKIVLKHLRKKMWDYMKKSEEEITCPVLLEPIDDFKNFCLFGCGHHASRQFLQKIQKQECPVCKKHNYNMWSRNSWCSSDAVDKEDD